MNREEKAAVVDQVATQIQESEAIFAVDYRGISVPQAAELREQAGRGRRHAAGGQEHAHRARRRQGRRRVAQGAARGPDGVHLREGRRRPGRQGHRHLPPRARGPPSRAARWTATPSRIEELEAISKLPARDVLHGQLVGILASPVTGLVRGLNQLIAGPGARSWARSPSRAWSAARRRAEEARSRGGRPLRPRRLRLRPRRLRAEAGGAAGRGGDAGGRGGARAEDSGDAPAEEETSGDEPAENDETDAPSEGDAEAKEG